MSTVPRTQEARREATRGALVAAARRLFVERGYAATGTPELVAEAGVTRGALYHHFDDKSELLMAVASDMAVEVAEAVGQAVAADPAAASSPLAALLAGSRAYFAAMAEGGRARVLLVEAPAVLAPAQLALLNEAAGAAELRVGLEACRRRGRGGREVPLEALTGLLSAAFDRAALAVAEGEDPAAWTAAMDLLLGAVAGEIAR